MEIMGAREVHCCTNILNIIHFSQNNTLIDNFMFIIHMIPKYVETKHEMIKFYIMFHNNMAKSKLSEIIRKAVSKYMKYNTVFSDLHFE